MGVVEPSFGDDGLVPCITQDARTGRVLTLAWMNAEAYRLTVETGEVHFFSRSRGELWHKGETSGNVQRVVQLRLDCDGDTLLALVEPAGPACHTGEKSCFYRTAGDGSMPDPAVAEALEVLTETLESRAAEMPEGSYTARLLGDPALAGEKVREEAAEVVEAASAETEQRVLEEAADVLYHLAVLLASRDLRFDGVFEVLNERRT
jgi:phosphoribosyl-ATP pyrophosphohydrolase/phosphoribosyl-AMP cyclohydrolase